MDDLIVAATSPGAGGIDGPLIDGLVHYGPHFLRRFEDRARADERFRGPFQRAWELFGAWMGGQLYTDDPRELEWRARAGLELWRRGGNVAQAFELFAAQCLLALPHGHPLRDETLARSMIETALQRAREAGDQLETLKCGRSLLWSLHLPWEDNNRLIDEGLAIIAALGDGADEEAVRVESGWRLAAAMALSIKGDRTRSLLERSLEVYEPVMTRQHEDPQAAIRTVWQWGQLLMNAGYLRQAAETFAAVRDLDTEGADLWWHATYEGGLTWADVGDWPRARRLLSSIQDSLLVNYAAWICFVPEASDLGTARLSAGGEANAQRELSEGLGALALAEATGGDWTDSFRHLETTKALDYRQRAFLRHPRAVAGVTAARTEGHSAWMHGVPVIRMNDERAQLTTVLASELKGPTIKQVARSLASDQAVLSLGVGQGTWGVCITARDAERPSGTFLRADAGAAHWLDLLRNHQVAELFGGSDDITRFDDGLSALLGQADEFIAAPIAKLLRRRGIRHLTVIPHGWLNMLPVSALPSFSEVAVSFAASAHLVADAARDVSLGQHALMVVDPTGDLPAAHAERAALERHGLADRLALQTLTGDEATAAALSGALRGAGLLHFAGHATGDPTFPSEAGLVVAAGATTASASAAKGRIWRVGELEAEVGALDSCALAILSACESGRGSIRIDSISDYGGLPPALVSLGVRAVVATLWRIPDDLGALFADLFYERLAASTRVDLPWLVHDTSLGLRTLTGSESAERLTALRAKVDDAMARVRIEAYARRLGRVGAEKPFGGPASWACFYHTGARYLHLPDPGQVS